MRALPARYNAARASLRASRARTQDFIAAASAGNAADSHTDEGFAATIYPGIKEALPNSTLSAATDPDPFYGFIQNRTLWANPNFPDLPDLTATADEATRLHDAVVATGMDRVGPSSNVIVVGSATQGASIAALRESRFSNLGSDLLAVGENVVTFSGVEQGTSLSSPQIAGLASYLWLLSPALRAQPSAATVGAIIANTGVGATGNEVLDAYATVLSLDEAELPTPASAPVRLAILDVNDDGKFDESDLELFVAQYLDANGNPLEPTVPDYGRFDLNGDGFTGGSGTARFDLDRTGSTRFGATAYASDTQQQIEGRSVAFDENALTDMQILCYYAYSSLYTGDVAARAQLVGRCAGPQVKVTPASVTLNAGQTQPFAAQVVGAQDVRVTWAVDGVIGGDASAGTISDTGEYIAPAASGSHTVRATSVEDPSAFGEASVTVRVAACAGTNVLGYILATSDKIVDPDPVSGQTQLTNSLTSSASSSSISVAYGRAQMSAEASDIGTRGESNGVSGGGAVAQGQFEDEVIIVPTDPTLAGTPASVAVSFRVTASPRVSGDRALAAWHAHVSFPFALDAGGGLSTVPGQAQGDLSGGTYSLSGALTLGRPTVIVGLVSASVGTACATGEPCPSGLTGAASIEMSFDWQGMRVTDSQGNAIGFSVCSASGTNWASHQ